MQKTHFCVFRIFLTMNDIAVSINVYQNNGGEPKMTEFLKYLIVLIILIHYL